MIVLKTLWKKEKMLVDSIFSFLHNAFNKVCFPRLVKQRIDW